LVAVFFEIREDDDVALVGGEPVQRDGERFAELAFDESVDGGDGERTLAPVFLRGVIPGYLFMVTPFPSPKFVAIKVRHDPEDPGAEIRARLERTPRFEDADERILGQIPGVGFIPRQAIGVVIGRLAVLLDGLLEECVLIARRRIRSDERGRPSRRF
jgi:hypothetical protein